MSEEKKEPLPQEPIDVPAPPDKLVPPRERKDGQPEPQLPHKILVKLQDNPLNEASCLMENVLKFVILGYVVKQNEDGTSQLVFQCASNANMGAIEGFHAMLGQWILAHKREEAKKTIALPQKSGIVLADGYRIKNPKRG